MKRTQVVQSTVYGHTDSTDSSDSCKLHVHCVNILRDITIFIFGPFGLKLPIHAHFGDMTGFPLELGTGARGQKASFKIDLAVLTQYWHMTDRHPASQPSFHSKYRAMLHVTRVKNHDISQNINIINVQF